MGLKFLELEINNRNNKWETSPALDGKHLLHLHESSLHNPAVHRWPVSTVKHCMSLCSTARLAVRTKKILFNIFRHGMASSKLLNDISNIRVFCGLSHRDVRPLPPRVVINDSTHVHVMWVSFGYHPMWSRHLHEAARQINSDEFLK